MPGPNSPRRQPNPHWKSQTPKAEKPAVPREEGIRALWPGYLDNGYFDGSGNLRTEFVIRGMVHPLAQAMANGSPPLSSHQVRRFFQHCRAIEAKLRDQSTSPESAEGAWLSEQAAFRKLDIAAADAYGKRERKIPALFHEFILCNVSAVKSRRDFLDGFIPHFEALVGFGSALFKTERN